MSEKEQLELVQKLAEKLAGLPQKKQGWTLTIQGGILVSLLGILISLLSFFRPYANLPAEFQQQTQERILSESNLSKLISSVQLKVDDHDRSISYMQQDLAGIKSDTKQIDQNVQRLLSSFSLKSRSSHE